MVAQRDIIEVVFDDNLGGNHPAIVISNKLVQEVEGYFVCIMMTSKDHDVKTMMMNSVLLSQMTWLLIR